MRACVLHWHAGEAQSHRETRRFLAEYRLAYGRDPTDQAALTYDALGLILHAVAAAGTDPEAVRDALAAIDGYRGVTGKITYGEAGGDPAKRLLIGWVREGEVVVFKVIEPVG